MYKSADATTWTILRGPQDARISSLRHIEAYRASVKMAAERGAFEIYNAEKEANNPMIARIREADPALYEETKAISLCYRPATKVAGFHICSSLLPLPLSQPFKGLLYYLLPLKGSSYSFTLNLSNAISCFSCSDMYFFIVASLSPTVLT